MSGSTQFKYSGATPGADSNAYVLFSTVDAGMPESVCTSEDAYHSVFDIEHDQAGVIKAYKSHDGGATWIQVAEQEATPAADATTVFDLRGVDQYPHWKVEWVNGGVAQNAWAVDHVLSSWGGGGAVDVTLSAATATFVITGVDAELSSIAAMAADPGAFTITGNAASFDLSLSAEAGAFIITGNVASFDLSLAAEAGAFAVTGNPMVADLSMPADAGAFIITGNAASFDLSLGATAGTFDVTGNAVELNLGLNLDAETGSFVVTGYGVGTDLSLAADPGAFTITGNAVAFDTDSTLYAATGVFEITGNDAVVGAFASLDAEAAAFTITGNDAGLDLGLNLDAAAGAFTITGNDAGLDLSIAAESGAFAVTGSAAALDLSMAAAAGALAITGNAASFDLSLGATVGTFDVTGNAAELNLGRTMDASAGSFSVIGYAATFDLSMSAEAAAFTITGNAATFDVGSTLAADAGAFTITGNAAALDLSMSAAAASFTITGNAATLTVDTGAEAAGTYLASGVVLASASTPTLSGAFTICGWARHPNSAWSSVGYIGGAPNPQVALVHTDVSNQLGLYASDAGEGYSNLFTTAVTTTAWYFWALVFNGSGSVTLWLGTASVAVASQGSLSLYSNFTGYTEGAIRLGDDGLGEYLAGDLRYVRVFTTALSESALNTERLATEPSAGNVWANWPLAEASLSDTSGNSRNLTASGGSAATTTTAPTTPL